MAIIGYGNKNYGFIRLDAENIVKLEEIFRKANVKFMENLNSKYGDDDLSARRLLRLFRYQIQNFIIENNRASYLWQKYAIKTNLNFMKICFPGGEHLVETKEEAMFLLDTYGQVDNVHQTKFRQRLQRVFIARGIIEPSFFSNKNY